MDLLSNVLGFFKLMKFYRLLLSFLFQRDVPTFKSAPAPMYLLCDCLRGVYGQSLQSVEHRDRTLL